MPPPPLGRRLTEPRNYKCLLVRLNRRKAESSIGLNFFKDILVTLSKMNMLNSKVNYYFEHLCEVSF